jgi:hypothetical protein
MPPYIRRNRGWDWFTPAEITHVARPERVELLKEARQKASADRFHHLLTGWSILLFASVLCCILAPVSTFLTPDPRRRDTFAAFLHLALLAVAG